MTKGQRKKAKLNTLPDKARMVGRKGAWEMIEIRIVGPPAAQGNHRSSKSGHVYETTKNHKPWRAAVSWAAVEARTKLGLASPAVRGPVVVEMIFTVPKPKGAPKKRTTYPDKKPDLSKLVRSTEDALSDAGIWEDDARVVSMAAAKRYPNEGPDALDVPGAVIRVREMLDRVGLSAAPAKTESVLNEGICEIAEREREQGIQNIEDCR